MNQSELSEIISNKTGIPVAQARQVVATIFQSMTEVLSRGDRVDVRGLGAFLVRAYPPYQGRNPRTGVRVDVRPKRKAVFRLGKELQFRIQRGLGDAFPAGQPFGVPEAIGTETE